MKNSQVKKYIGGFICKYKGHDWEIYTVSTGYYSYDIEQAGYCKRCGYDTHGEYPQCSKKIRRK